MKCESCKNKDICKYVEEMAEADQHVNAYHNAQMELTPISVESKCSKYESKTVSKSKCNLANDIFNEELNRFIRNNPPYTVRYQE